MTISTPTPEPVRRRRAFTLVEVMIAVSISSFVLAGVLSTFLMLTRSGQRLVYYSDMDRQSRRALEEFAQDVRMASGITWNSATSITLTVPDNYAATGKLVTYAWDTTSGSSSYHYFYRTPADTSAASGTKTTYIANVTSLTFTRFDRTGASISNSDTSAALNTSTKRVQIAITISSTNNSDQGFVSATDTLVSASYVMRNKSTG